METQLEIIKSNLPSGYEGTIAKEVGCSVCTVHNILNGKHASRSTFKVKILSAATKLAQENINAMQGVADTAAKLNSMNNGTNS